MRMNTSFKATENQWLLRNGILKFEEAGAMNAEYPFLKYLYKKYDVPAG